MELEKSALSIDQFIKTFKKDFVGDQALLVRHFTNGYCYHFATILNSLFGSEDGLNGIVYNPVENHFAFYSGGKFYDITGEIPQSANWYSWDYYKGLEPNDAERVIEQCCYKVYKGVNDE